MAREGMNAEALQSAFEAFNHQSSQLEASYADLRGEIDRLARELSRSRAAAERQLREKELLGHRLVQLLEALPAAVVVLDENGIITDCNQSALSLLDEPLIGCAWSAVVHREFRGSRKSAGGDLKLRDGRCFSLARRSLGDRAGEILLLTDITGARNMSDLLDRQSRLSDIGEMTARLGHQIRTPLASALLYAGKLENNADESRAGTAQNLAQRLREMSGMVDDMLRYAKGTRRAGDLLTVGKMLELVADAVRPLVRAPAKLRVSLTEDLQDHRIEVDAEALKGALCNLICNALQACDADGVASPLIELGAVRLRDQVCLTVTDNGHGVPHEICARLFEPFFTTRPQGTGLGLAIVRSVAEAHGGDVIVDSGPDGTTFSMCLPISAARQSDDDAFRESPDA